MSTIQNLKNFIRHGKQARATNAEPTTNVSPVHAHQQQRHHQQAAHYALSDPQVVDHNKVHAQPHPQEGGYSAAAVDNRNVAARAGEAAAHAAGQHQRKEAAAAEGSTTRKEDNDPTVVERIVAEERAAKGKMPRYPGLERWTLIEKMGDGAFSNVYRAKDNTGQYGECAIKVVRKFEMNSSQVSRESRGDTQPSLSSKTLLSTPLAIPSSLYTLHHVSRACTTCPTSSPFPHSLSFLGQQRLGRQRTASGLQKGSEDCGGAHPTLSFLAWIALLAT